MSTVLNVLFDKAKDNLSEDEKQWLASGVNETLINELDNLHRVTLGIAGLVSEDNSAGIFNYSENLGAIMYSLAHQLDVLRGLTSLTENMEGHSLLRQYQAKTGG